MTQHTPGPSIYRTFDGMCWPVPCAALNELEWSLRYAQEPSSRDLMAASVVDAYRALIAMPSREREKRVRELRRGPGVAAGEARSQA